MGSKIIRIALLCLLPLLGYGQIGYRKVDTALVVTQGGIVQKWKTWNYTKQKIDSTVSNGINTKAILNQTGQQASSNFNISGYGVIGGRLGIGTMPSLAAGLHNIYSLTGSNTAYGNLTQSTITSGVTSAAYGHQVILATEAASFNVATATYYSAARGSIGAGSSIGTQIGFAVQPTLIGATNNYGYYGGIDVASGRWNLYMVGTAQNYLNGSLGLGVVTPTEKLDVLGNGKFSGSLELGVNAVMAGNLSVGLATSTANVGIRNSRDISGGSTAYGNLTDATINSPVTAAAYGYRAQLSTQAASFSVGSVQHFEASLGTIGAGSSIVSDNGFVASSNLQGTTSTAGFLGQVTAGAGKYNLNMGGTAQNYLKGNLGIDVLVPTEKLDVLGNGKFSGTFNIGGVLTGSSATFSSTITASTVPTLGGHLGNKTYIDGLNATNVKVTGTQSVDGDKSFVKDLHVNGITVGLGNNSVTTNTAVGLSSLLGNTTGSNNTSIGNTALQTNTTGLKNVAVGNGALFTNDIGNSNTAIGYNALYGSTYGFGNTAIGQEALYSNSTGTSNVAIGISALRNGTSVSNSIAIGRDALLNATDGDNVAIGYNALKTTTGGDGNVAIGYGTLANNTTGDYNIAIGKGALAANTTGRFITAVGLNADVSPGSNLINATAIGNSALVDADNKIQLGNASVTLVNTSGSYRGTQFILSSLNTAPASATAPGTTGEIRVTATYIYVCTAASTWVRVALATW